MATLAPTLDQFNSGTDKSAVTGRDARSAGRVTTRADNSPSDEELLIAVSNGRDVQAFNVLFQRFSGRIFAMGMKLTRNEQLAKELVQEAMLTVWQKAPLYDLERGLAQNWIFTLTRNRCFDALRRIKQQPQCVSADEIFGPGYDLETTESVSGDEFMQLELAQVERYCAELPAPQQEVIRQIYVLDRTHEEAAQALEIPLGTLKSRLRLGLARLQQLLGVSE